MATSSGLALLATTKAKIANERAEMYALFILVGFCNAVCCTLISGRRGGTTYNITFSSLSLYNGIILFVYQCMILFHTF